MKAPFSSLPYLDGASFLIPNLFCKFFYPEDWKIIIKNNYEKCSISFSSFFIHG